ncbi:response regulator transcription factor RpaB [Acaryochloris marina NIES-2412]|uniref:response regulator transcription factor RpaB n=1 Tax=Acaryochloris marina TaxID=155978 RepID=UPI0040581CB0
MKSDSMDSESSPQYKILVVDDEASTRQILDTRLSMMGYEVITAIDGLEALELFHTQHLDLIILDVMMPKLDGYGVCQSVRETSRIPIIMLTALSEVNNRITGLDMGADDYMIKPFSPKELEARIQCILRRLEAIKFSDSQFSGVIQMGSLRIDTNKRQVFLKKERINLTHMEFCLLEFLAVHPNIEISRQKLLQKVWGYSINSMIDSRVVDVHISRLRHKLRADQEKSMSIKTVHGLGYSLQPSHYEIAKHAAHKDTDSISEVNT